MDHLPRPNLGHPGLRVPFITTALFDGGDFFSFPQRLGFGASYENCPAQELGPLLQSWLYFGVLDKFFSRTVDREAFLQKDTGERQSLTGDPDAPSPAVTSAALLDLTTHWLRSTVVPALSLDDQPETPPMTAEELIQFRDTFVAFLEEVAAEVSKFERLPQCGAHPLPTILLSVKVMIITLSGVLRESIFDGDVTDFWADTSYFPGLLENLFPLTSPPSASTPPSTQLLLDLFTARGWCPYISRQICRTFNYAVVYYVTQLPNPSRVTHDECTEQACVGNNVDMINYTTRHAIPDCKCQHVSIPLQDMRDIIRTGGVPLVLVHETADHSVQLRVTRMTHRTPFVAFSHVWSDGLGNPSANSLPECQLRRLSKYVYSTSMAPQAGFMRGIVNFEAASWDFNTVSTNSVVQHFWLDTLCIPVGDAFNDLKMRAVNQMAAIYSNAVQVPVLDSTLESVAANDPGITTCEILARICASPWMNRCWTFQEGSLSRTAKFQCLDGAFDPYIVPVGQPSIFTGWVDGSPFHQARSMFRMWRWGLKNRFNVHKMSYTAMFPPDEASKPMTALLARPLKAAVMQQFQGLKRMFSTPYRLEPESLYMAFIECWNALADRTTTKREDVHIILANLLNFNAFTILSLEKPEDRVVTLLWSLHSFPFTTFFNPRTPRCRPGENHNQRWVPLYPSEPLLYPEIRADFSGLGVCLDSETCMRRPSWQAAVATSPRLRVLLVQDRISAEQNHVRYVEDSSPKGFSYRVDLHRAPGDTMAQEMGTGSCCIVIEFDSTDETVDNDKMDFPISRRGAMFQIIRDRVPSPPHTDHNEEAGHRTLEVVYDCPVTLEIERRGSSPAPAGTKTSRSEVLAAEMLQRPWHLDVRCGESVRLPSPSRNILCLAGH